MTIEEELLKELREDGKVDDLLRSESKFMTRVTTVVVLLIIGFGIVAFL